MFSLCSATGWRQRRSTHNAVVRATDYREGVAWGREFESQWCIFSPKVILFAYTFFWTLAILTLSLGIPSTHRNGTWAKLNARHLGTRKGCNGYISAFVCRLQRIEGTGVEGRQGQNAVISCGTFLSKPHRQTAQLWIQSPVNFFFQLLDLFWSRFFYYLFLFVQWWHMFWAFALILLYVSHQA